MFDPKYIFFNAELGASQDVDTIYQDIDKDIFLSTQLSGNKEKGEELLLLL